MVDDPLALEPRFRRAAFSALWFAAVFCVVCGALAIAAAVGFFGNSEDALLLGAMALAGAILLGAQLIANRFLLRLPPEAKND